MPNSPKGKVINHITTKTVSVVYRLKELESYDGMSLIHLADNVVRDSSRFKSVLNDVEYAPDFQMKLGKEYLHYLKQAIFIAEEKINQQIKELISEKEFPEIKDWRETIEF